jgi:hypothetical protein
MTMAGSRERAANSAQQSGSAGSPITADSRVEESDRARRLGGDKAVASREEPPTHVGLTNI